MGWSFVSVRPSSVAITLLVATPLPPALSVRPAEVHGSKLKDISQPLCQLIDALAVGWAIAAGGACSLSCPSLPPSLPPSYLTLQRVSRLLSNRLSHVTALVDTAARPPKLMTPVPRPRRIRRMAHGQSWRRCPDLWSGPGSVPPGSVPGFCA